MAEHRRLYATFYSRSAEWIRHSHLEEPHWQRCRLCHHLGGRHRCGRFRGNCAPRSERGIGLRHHGHQRAVDLPGGGQHVRNTDLESRPPARYQHQARTASTVHSSMAWPTARRAHLAAGQLWLPMGRWVLPPSLRGTTYTSVGGVIAALNGGGGIMYFHATRPCPIHRLSDPIRSPSAVQRRLLLPTRWHWARDPSRTVPTQCRWALRAPSD